MLCRWPQGIEGGQHLTNTLALATLVPETAYTTCCREGRCRWSVKQNLATMLFSGGSCSIWRRSFASTLTMIFVLGSVMATAPTQVR